MELAKQNYSTIGKQDVYFRTVAKSDKIDFDNFGTGEIDYSDFKNSDIKFQSMMFSHIICERFGTEDYE